MFYSRQHVPLDSYYQQASKNVKSKLLHADITKITSSEAAALAEEFSKGFELRKIQLHLDQLTKAHIRRVQTVPAEEREEFYRNDGDLEVEFEYIQVRIPVDSSSDLEDYKKFLPSSYSLSWSPTDLNITNGHVEFEIVLKGYGVSMDEARVKREFEFQKTQIAQWVNSLNQDISRLNEALKRELVPFIESRQRDLKKGETDAGSILDSL